MGKNKYLRHDKSLFFALLIIIISTIGLVSCSRADERQAQGYIEGRYTYMATSSSGVLKDIAVARGNRVKSGQLLFVLDPQPQTDEFNAQRETLKQAIASRDAIAANLEYAKLTYERYRVLVPKHAIQQSQLDNAQSILNANIAQLAQANAAIAEAQATLARSKWSKEQKVITSPVDAVVFDTYYRLGEFTVAEKAILSLLAPENIKAIFFIKEVDLGAIKLGDSVSINCSNCQTNVPAKISFISPTAEYTPPVIFSESTNAKLIFRVEAEFSREDAIKLHPGQPISVKYLNHGR